MIEELQDGVVVLGTAHIAQSSVDEVERTIRERRPSKVLVELDARRFEALRDPEAWQKTDIIQVIKQKKQHLFLLQLYLASMQAQMGRETGVAPGSEMLRAIEVADEVGAEVVLIDRDVAITLKRGFGSMSLWQRLQLFWKVWMEILTPADDGGEEAGEDPGPEGGGPGARPRDDAWATSHGMRVVHGTGITAGAADVAAGPTAAPAGGPSSKSGAARSPTIRSAADVEALLQKDAITQMTEEFARFAPKIKVALIDERDAYMASHIRDEAASGSLVAVVGAGHMPGIKRHFAHPAGLPSRDDLDQPPARRFTLGKFIAYAVPLGILAIFGVMIYQGRFAELWANIRFWILINGSLTALGVILARGHILSAIVGFVASPITSLNPLLAAGWFAGLMEAKIHTPTVADFQAIKQIETFSEFWRNDVVRIVLVTALANVGSVIGTYVAGFEIVRTFVGGT